MKLFFLLAILACSYGAMARPLVSMSSSTLKARLKLEEGSTNCWDSLMQLQACTGEIILFFLNGETFLGHGCCEAIRVISEQCWPNMIDTIGFTSEEGDILEGYCDNSTSNQTFKAIPLPPESSVFSAKTTFLNTASVP